MSKRRRPAPPVPDMDPIVVDVRSVTNAAFNAGLSIDLAQDALEEAPDGDCRVVYGKCRECGDPDATFLIALRVFADRDVIYCDGCRVADVGV